MKLYDKHGFELITDRGCLVLINKMGEWENHSHFASRRPDPKKRKKRKKDGKRHIIIEGFDVTEPLMVIDFVRHNKMADSVFIVRACMRLSTDDQYKEACKQKIDKLIQHKYINVGQKGPRHNQRLRV